MDLWREYMLRRCLVDRGTQLLSLLLGNYLLLVMEHLVFWDMLTAKVYPYPGKQNSSKGLLTVRAACGVWHTAAVVEVMVGSPNTSNCSSRRLFTWGDGDKGHLGHVSCGHSMTIALTTNGHVYTMGSHVSGLLGNPQAVEELPICVEGNLTKNFVQEIACGAFHVAVITSKTEVYTWGKGASGQLGHGDTDDRNPPFLVEALKDKEDKSVACGTSFTAAIKCHNFIIVDMYSAMLAAVRRLIRFPEALQTIMNKIKNKKLMYDAFS
ncbi:hypothetical protein GQ457_14G018720 [Hibiscus cannabinus]